MGSRHVGQDRAKPGISRFLIEGILPGANRDPAVRLVDLTPFVKRGDVDPKAFYPAIMDRFSPDGKVCAIPSDIAPTGLIYYNKKIFDEAGVPYPKAPWTWDDYVATAKKLTNRDKGIWGSYFNLAWEYYFYMIARQRGVSAYKKDGSSNYDDPAFRDALKFMYDLGETFKVQPTYKEYLANKYTWDTFASQGKFGMIYIGSWFTGLLTDPKTYPRDWKWGIVEAPAAGANGKNNLMAGGTWAVLKNAKHPQNAAKYIAYVSENWFREAGGIPARVNLTPADIQQILGASIAEKSGGSVTVAELDAALLHNSLGVQDEKITGAKAKEYTDIIVREAQMYLSGEQSLDATVRNVKSQADRALLGK